MVHAAVTSQQQTSFGCLGIFPDTHERNPRKIATIKFTSGHKFNDRPFIGSRVPRRALEVRTSAPMVTTEKPLPTGPPWSFISGPLPLLKNLITFNTTGFVFLPVHSEVSIKRCRHRFVVLYDRWSGRLILESTSFKNYISCVAEYLPHSTTYFRFILEY